MSWTTLQPAACGPKQGGDVVTISVSKPGRIVQRAYVTVRTELLAGGGLGWWTHRRPVTVEIGDGEHAGRIRLRDQGPHRTMGPTGKHAKVGRPAAPMLQIAGLPGVPAEGMSRRPVSWEIVGDALVIILPWSHAKGSTKMVAPTATPSPVAQPSRAPQPPAKPPTEPAIAAVAAPDKPAAKTTAAAPKASIAVPYAEIEQWAIANGLGTPTHGFDLAKINERRVALGKSPWTIRKAHREAAL